MAKARQRGFTLLEIVISIALLVMIIAVLMNGFGFTGAMEKIGVERRLLTAGENKGLLDPFSPLKPEHQAHAQNMLDQIFIGIVPLGLTLLCYYLLKKKNVSITVLIIGVIILSILLSLLGIA